MKQLLLASGNRGKLRELSLALQDFGFELQLQPKDAAYEVAETGSTFVENAIIKARHASQISGLPTLADDSGLIVPALKGEPGVYSARYDGEQASDSDNSTLLIKNMRNIDDRRAYFYCCLVMMQHADDPAPVIAEGRWYGEISQQSQGDGGFGYDPVFYLPDLNCSAAELPAAEKLRLSHRGQAVQQLKSRLQPKV
ncbi:non-canonical purine NTP pyrophosphatase [Marinicella pacifica]|uniref:dITP/XTP pyrophosphatase n=1 Tax=Marinicella pacifica TaxID=1171543 RepID=A0A917CPF7_9GAMM|nr:RdgB/HAM1 family non-canonical purine NTP pyrophosphatase [Marinicella pacifica]GGF93378.1 non-canonical purine NTP pyrophosphatase [Marinicella pacifica]